jgi:hypothetical protein
VKVIECKHSSSYILGAYSFNSCLEDPVQKPTLWKPGSMERRPKATFSYTNSINL